MARRRDCHHPNRVFGRFGSTAQHALSVDGEREACAHLVGRDAPAQIFAVAIETLDDLFDEIANGADVHEGQSSSSFVAVFSVPPSARKDGQWTRSAYAEQSMVLLFRSIVKSEPEVVRQSICWPTI
jgi:hypothetical protein